MLYDLFQGESPRLLMLYDLFQAESLRLLILFALFQGESLRLLALYESDGRVQPWDCKSFICCFVERIYMYASASNNDF